MCKMKTSTHTREVPTLCNYHTYIKSAYKITEINTSQFYNEIHVSYSSSSAQTVYRVYFTLTIFLYRTV